MKTSFVSVLAKLVDVDLFARDKDTNMPTTGFFVGNPFYMDYDKAKLMVADSWKFQAGGIPQGALLLAYYFNDNEPNVEEAILLRVLGPTSLPTDSDVVSSMVEFYKETVTSDGRKIKIDDFTRYEFSFSGVECRVLGTFYKDKDESTCFGADVENFMSAHHYKVIKPNAKVLEKIVNFKKEDVTNSATDIQLGKVRYSSSRRHQEKADEVPVYVTPKDFLGKRTAMFGMTRTGKSNTVKMIISATATMSDVALNKSLPARTLKAGEIKVLSPEEMEPFTKDGKPKFPVGQMIFDVNGEYANPNLQDKGTAIYEIYASKTIRYSVLQKSGFKVMKVNFFNDVESGFELVKSYLSEDSSDYIKSFLAANLTKPEDYSSDDSARIRHDRRIAAYLCCLKKAGFKEPDNFTVKFEGNATLNQLAGGIDPSNGVTLDQAINWWVAIWQNYGSNPYFTTYRTKKGKDWADDDLKSMLIMLTQRKVPGAASPGISGYIKLRPISDQHTNQAGKPFEEDIIEHLRKGGIVIADLSQGEPTLQRMFSERICRKIFNDAMDRFIHGEHNNFIQFNFEEAHNLFPKKDDKDLALVYNRLAKEGAKLQLGMTYATQEVSSISSNILKNTQNWFIAHLNNEDETRELRKYYDFGDFTEGLVRFSASSDQGFVRMKTYSNPFVVPVQIDLFGTSNDQLSTTNNK